MGGLRRFCSCGHELKPGRRFCPVCGRPAANAARGPRVPVTGRLLLLAGLAAAGVALAVTAVVVLHPFQHTVAGRGAAQAGPGTGRPSPAASAARTPLTSASSAPTSPRQAAESLAGLLASSVTDRSSVVGAVADVSRCGPGLSQDPGVFRAAVASRRRLLTQLASLPGRSALPTPLLAALTTAWQASAAADGDFARWAQDEISAGCTPSDQADPGFQAATAPDDQATAAKKAFARAWRPIAAQYRLQAYRWDQL